MPITVAALIRSGSERVRFASGLQRNITVQFAETALEVIDQITNGRVDAVIVGLHNERGESLAPAAQSIRRRFPFVTVLFYLSLVGSDVREALALASSIPPNGVIIRGIDDLSLTIMQAVLGTRETGATNQIVALIGRIAAPGLGDTLSFMARHAARPLHVADVAHFAGVSRRTLFNRFRRAGLPTVARCIHWLRILHAAARLDAPNVTVEQIADQLGFPSSSTLRHLIKRLTGLTASEIRESGGFSYLLGRATLVFASRSIAGGDDSSSPIDIGQIHRIRECADTYRADGEAEHAPALTRQSGAADDDCGDYLEYVL
jgi:AraC-like DNA-binding protein